MKIPSKIENTFIEINVDLFGVIKTINSGNFCASEFTIHQSIYPVCPFLEGTLDALQENETFCVDGMVLSSKDKEFNIEVQLLKKNDEITVLIENRTNIYQYIIELNQNRNDVSLVKEKIAKQNIELRKLRELADKANEEKSRFLAVMSHEIRNPLNSILAYAAIILEETTTETIKKYAKSLAYSGKNLHFIVDEILDISRIEAGKLQLMQAPIALKEIVLNCIDSFILQNKESPIQLKPLLLENVPEFVLGDAVRINQVLSNLIKNAYKFTQNGHIAVQLSVTKENEDTCTINFKIKDTGRGMTQKQLESIFNEYEQVEVTDFTISKGAGLGLSIVKRLITLMQGTITVESQVGVGTIFDIQIPFQISEKLAQKAITKEVLKKDLSDLKVLYADDDLLNQSIAKHFLQKEHITATTVGDGLEALQLLQTKPFDLVLLDIHMPNVSGEEVVQQTESYLAYNQQIPLIAVTANTSKENIERYLSIGFKDVLPKPYTAKNLISVIENSLK